MKEDDEQYLGSDDPDINDTAADDQPKPKKSSQTTQPIQTIDESRNLRKTEAEIKHLNDPAENQLESISALDPKAPEFALPSVPLQSECVVSNGSAAYCNPMVTNCNAEVTSLVPPAAFWEKMELRMTQPPPVPAPFDGDPSRYLRFRADFRDQVESRASLTDSEKMNYLMTYTAGKAREVVENYRGLPNGSHIALQMLRQRFGQNAMVVEALKSSVVNGPKLKNGDSAALLALSDKVQNCCWAMIELQSKELDCTTNLRQIYDRLPYP